MSTTTTGRRGVSGYKRKDGTRVRSYSQRYQKGDARAVAGAAAVATVSAVVSALHLFTAVLGIVTAAASLIAVILLGRAEVRRRRMRANRRRSRGRYMVVQAWRSHRAKRPPAKRRTSTRTAGRTRSAGQWRARSGGKSGPWAKRRAPWASEGATRVSRSGTWKIGKDGKPIKVTEGSYRNTGR